MVLNEAETQILKSIVTSAHNASNYGYEVAVKGTIVDGASTILVSILALLITIYAIKIYRNWIPKQKELSTEAAYIWGVMYALVIYLASNFIFSMIFHDALMYIFAPEYVVVTKIMAGAAAVVT